MKTLKGIVFFAMVSLLGCDFGNEVGPESSSSTSTTLSSPTATITINSATPSALPSGNFEENTLMSVTSAGVGSQGSTATCVLTVSQKTSTETSYTDRDVLNGCGSSNISLNWGAGSYRLKLVVTDGNSLTAEDQKFLNVDPVAITSSPILAANFMVTPSSSTTNTFDVALDATTSTKGQGGDISTYTWQVRKKQDDGFTTLIDTLGPYNSPTTSIVVNNDGIYVVQLTIADVAANTVSSSKSFSISTDGNALIPSFTITVPGTGTAPLNLAVDASGSSVTNVDHYIWEVYDSSDITTYTYRVETESPTTSLPIVATGIYLVKLKIIDGIGNEHETTLLQNIL